MPKVQIQRKSTDTDMTPFVDIAFLILSFFIMATKIKAPDPVKTTPPNSVSTKKLEMEKSLLITIDGNSQVFISIPNEEDQKRWASKLIENINSTRTLNLTPAQMNKFARTSIIGTSFAQLGTLLNLPDDKRNEIKQTGIPISDSLNNELVWWVGSAKAAFADGRNKLRFLIKGDENAKYPAFEAVIDALKRNDELKYYLVTSMEEAPSGSDLYISRQSGSTKE
jgi:biopolymer transport protein ExbD